MLLKNVIKNYKIPYILARNQWKLTPKITLLYFKNQTVLRSKFLSIFYTQSPLRPPLNSSNIQDWQLKLAMQMSIKIHCSIMHTPISGPQETVPVYLIQKQQLLFLAKPLYQLLIYILCLKRNPMNYLPVMTAMPLVLFMQEGINLFQQNFYMMESLMKLFGVNRTNLVDFCII